MPNRFVSSEWMSIRASQLVPGGHGLWEHEPLVDLNDSYRSMPTSTWRKKSSCTYLARIVAEQPRSQPRPAAARWHQSSGNSFCQRVHDGSPGIKSSCGTTTRVNRLFAD